MTGHDDALDAALRGFRADEGHLDDDARARIDARVRALTATSSSQDRTEPDAALAEADADPGQPRRSQPTRRGWLVAAAAVAVLGVVGVLASGVGGRDDVRTATTPATAPADEAPGLDTLADEAARRTDVTVLGSPGATYSHWVATRTVAAGDARSSGAVASWVDLDGTGRVAAPDAPADEGLLSDPGSIALGALPPDAALALPDDPDAVLAAFQAQDPDTPFAPADLSTAVARTLGVAGLPAPARAGLLRTLDEIGFVPLGPADDAGDTARYQGPGADGATVEIIVDVRSGAVLSIVQTKPNGDVDTTAFTTADLRDDLDP